ncbi:hypothetical protein QNI16_05545 [Cytophagaceae bacterium YF14B1]|uniref:Uncharacterized protein n=1 Tax=Xanthocytophaga flava TaxID=3048013 RepID=A0AAE3U559_9BACT|nr:hypothetical protein [Xanthocytophaga flavus]MDJ1479941.1 hypothetical protein [Xanthocytophaga flavus]
MSGNVYVFLLFMFVSCKEARQTSTKEKEFYEKIEELVLSENKPNQEYHFEIKQPQSILEYDIVYVGSLKSRNDSIKIVYRGVLSGNMSPQYNAYLSLYTSKNKKLGKYYISSVDMPKIQNSNLIFQNSSCDLTTTISLEDNIPESIFIRCNKIKGTISGDEYTFDKEE